MAEAARKKKQPETVPLRNFQGTKMERLQQLFAEWYGCERCLLHSFRKQANGQPSKEIVFGEGNPEAKIMIVGEAPGAEEEASSIPFVGDSGKLLNQMLAAHADDAGIQELSDWYEKVRHTKENVDHFHEKVLEWRSQEFFVTNIVACRPPDNRTPNNPEISACWERLRNIIYIVDPWFIIASGKSAAETLAHRRIEITKLRGSIFDVELVGRLVPYRIPMMVTLHPSYLLRQADWNSKTGSFAKTDHDILASLRYVDHMKNQLLGTPLPYRREALSDR